MHKHVQISGTSISKQLEEEGVAIVLDVLRPETVDDLVASIEHKVANRPEHSSHSIRHLVQAFPAARKVAESAAVRALVEPVLGSEAFVVRSLLFDKTADANWKVAWHQDLTIAVRGKIEVPGFSAWSVKDGAAHVQPPAVVLDRMLTVRLHLDDCDSANGPLQVIPGSHKSGRLKPRQISEWRERKQPVICAVPRGGALLMRPLLLHASSSASEPRHRRVVHLEFAAESLPGGLRWL
jgi:ectoine hydroxylase-related dioxygenase (phytanoyl-CoA dioxygenase family)